MKILEKSIKDGKGKCCPLCKNQVFCTSHHKLNKKYYGRDFWCKTCKSRYVYFRHGRNFLIMYIEYKLPNASVSTNYDHPARKNDWYARTRILPKMDKNEYEAWGPSWDYSSELKLDIELEFPISQEKLEEQVSLYITFS